MAEPVEEETKNGVFWHAEFCVCVRACMLARVQNEPCADRRCCCWSPPVSGPSRYQPNLYLTRYLPALRPGPELNRQV
jgi:hypothetical protein